MTTLEQLQARRGLLTAEELAALLNVSEKTVYRWSKSGSLPSVGIGKLVRFSQRRSAVGFAREEPPPDRALLSFGHGFHSHSRLQQSLSQCRESKRLSRF